MNLAQPGPAGPGQCPGCLWGAAHDWHHLQEFPSQFCVGRESQRLGFSMSDYSLHYGILQNKLSSDVSVRDYFSLSSLWTVTVSDWNHHDEVCSPPRLSHGEFLLVSCFSCKCKKVMA